MNVFKARLESFTRPKRGKGGTKSQSNQKWPHPEYFLATPETLAEAGFYFDPSSEDKDNVTCYMCGKELSEWDERDDPFEIHYKKCGKKCAWANVRCGLGAEMDADGRFVFTDKNRLPTSKAMEKARLDTFLFGDGWIHDQERNHGASSKKMAKAGFVYSPHDSHDDTAVCIYCGISLSGWDADDGPTEEHRSRVKKAGNPCPMFPDIVFAPPPSRSSKSNSKSKSKSSHVDVTVPMKTYDGSDNETVASDTARMGSVASTSMAKTPKASRTAKKGAKTPRVSRSRTIPVDEEDGVEEPTVKPSKKAPPSTRSRSVSRARSVASAVESDAGTGTEDEFALKRSTSTRSKGKAKDTGTRGGSEEDESGAASKKKRTKSRSQSKTRVSVIPEDISDEDDVEPPTPPPKSTKKSLARKPSTRAVAASKSSTKQKHIDEKPDVYAPAPSTKKVKPISNSVAAAAALFDDDDLEIRADGQNREPESATTTRSTRTLRKSTKPPSQSLSSSIINEKSALTKPASGISVSRGKSRTPAHNEEETDDDHDTLNTQMHVPPLTPSSVEPEPEPKVEPQEKPRYLETELSKSKTKQRPPPAHIETDFPEQDTAHPPPVPPRSPSRPKTKHLPASTDTDIDGQIVLELQSEDKKQPERAKSDTRETSSTEPPTKPLTVLPKSAAMKKQGSFLSSRSSTQSRTGTSIEHVMDISSDEDDEGQVEAAIRMQPLSIQTKSRFLTNVKPPSTSTAVSASTVENLESSVPAKGSVQAKIAQIEKHVDMSGEAGGKTSPFKPKLGSVDSFTAEPELNANTSKALEVEDDDIQMTGPSDSTGDKADSEAQQEEKRKISPLPRPAVTPPRSQQQVPTSPFKTPFRFGMGSGNPFSVPPTPGVPLDIPLGIPIPLSQELFVPTQELSETELNMTVEEWVRYHIQIEYDKFKEDGEREIDLFQKRAEEVRKTIGAL